MNWRLLWFKLAPYKPPPEHSLEESPCYSIIGKSQNNNSHGHGQKYTAIIFLQASPGYPNIFGEHRAPLQIQRAAQT